jgi:hypothetical protein
VLRWQCTWPVELGAALGALLLPSSVHERGREQSEGKRVSEWERGEQGRVAPFINACLATSRPALALGATRWLSPSTVGHDRPFENRPSELTRPTDKQLQAPVSPNPWRFGKNFSNRICRAMWILKLCFREYDLNCHGFQMAGLQSGALETETLL